ncbi:hypothetical protein [Nonomuraea sp. 10N515B]|uniref:hypothetical protein n=1 Tax=Nonomuraea sp. 10N515B TaxID=3457422 RepID=UPI003FCE9176
MDRVETDARRWAASAGWAWSSLRRTSRILAGRPPVVAQPHGPVDFLVQLGQAVAVAGCGLVIQRVIAAYSAGRHEALAAFRGQQAYGGYVKEGSMGSVHGGPGPAVDLHRPS